MCSLVHLSLSVWVYLCEYLSAASLGYYHYQPNTSLFYSPEKEKETGKAKRDGGRRENTEAQLGFEIVPVLFIGNLQVQDQFMVIRCFGIDLLTLLIALLLSSAMKHTSTGCQKQTAALHYQHP